MTTLVDWSSGDPLLHGASLVGASISYVEASGYTEAVFPGDGVGTSLRWLNAGGTVAQYTARM